jgi:DNA mismatch endonuclease (patch repair protein)
MAEGLVGWRRNYKKAFGAPDLAFPKLKLAIFVDGCFWHGCRCKSIPQTNKDFWVHKIALNSERDALVVKRLRARGWTVWRIMEHELKRNKRECARQELLKAVAKVSINDPLD